MKARIVGTLLVSASSVFLAVPVMAQDALEEIVVTGSRITRDGYTAPTPVTVAPVADLVKSTPSNIPDALNKLPQFQLSSSPSRSTHNFANSASHGNILNLRGVGGNRTLILFDGARVPPTTFRGDVDTNVIPNMLIERVDVVTAGASAAYGSDAVAGVVNFVLNRKFNGAKVQAQYGTSEQGDNETYRVGAAFGTDLLDGKGHWLFSAEQFDSKGMLRSDRDVANQGYIYAGKNPGAGTPGSAANPYVIYSGVKQNQASDGGKILSGPLANYRFLPDGSIVPFVDGTATGTPAYYVGGDGYRIPSDVTTVSPLKTQQIFQRFDYDVAPELRFYAQGGFTRSDLSYSSLANSFVAPTSATIYLDNPYLNLTTAQRAQLTAAGATSISVASYSPYAPKPHTEERTDYYNATLGFEGDIGADWQWNAGYVYGKSKHSMDQSGLFNWRNTYAALDAVRDGSGNIVCRATLDADAAIRQRFADCKPLNMMGEGSMLKTPDGYKYATGTSSYDAAISQHLVQAAFQGVLFDLPAGPLMVAAGGEYRTQKLKLNSNADPALLDTAAERAEYFRGVRGVPSSALFYWLTNVGSADGDVNVKEGFAEVNIPVLSDVAFAKSLDINAAGRVTDYSTSGRVETWKLGATWKPVDDFLLRATRSRDIRAPTLFDLYAGDQSAIGTLVDPVSGVTANVPQISGGNAGLKPEEADTFSFGGVLSPSGLPGFSLSVDYFRLKINGAIGSLSPIQIVTNCQASGGSAPECALIDRPSATAFPNSIRVAPANIAFLQTSGIDFDATYRTEAGPGDLTFRLYASYLDEYKTQQSATAPVYDFSGYGSSANQPVARPKWRGTLNVSYDIGDFNIFVSEQYIGKWALGSQEPNQNYNGAKQSAVWYTDATVTYRTQALGAETELFVTANNLFDRNPPLVPGTIPGLNLPTIISLYDTVGRAYTVGLRAKF
ncbi:TonB-dependent receptor plug domain-containing protein [Niveispirillum sp. KHB5.9]|uniref:TonB-dependent receptor plug domain-containing protein n=1 Tax=Niveispirillum sp. KHB5.9 TaxID=3400269 RepID=UPI003A8703FF